MNTVTRKRNFSSDGRHEVKFADFSHKYPTLMTYLLRELETATVTLHSPGAVDVHPSLNPILALLSRLRPSLQRDVHTNTGSEFIAPILRCAAGKYLAVRTTASRALVSVLTSTRLQEHVDEILEFKFLNSVARLNDVHGALLCTLEVIGEVRRSTYEDDVCWSEFSDAVCIRLISCAEIAMTSRSPLISAAWLRCAEATVAVANSATHSCKRVGCPCGEQHESNHLRDLMQMLWQCTAPVLSSAVAHHPGSSEWNKAAAGARVRLALGHDSSSVLLRKRVRDLLDTGDVETALLDTLDQSRDYEYRAEAYKAMFKTPCDGDDAFRLVAQRLRRFVAKSLASETRHSCSRRALQCIDAWSKLCVVDDEEERIIWDAVRRVTFSDINERVRAEGMRCLAQLCKRRLDVNADDILNSGTVNEFVQTISAGANPLMSDETRSASMDALAQSELLSHLKSSILRDEQAGELALLTWKCALTLVEDEDQEIRAKASVMISAALSNSPSHAHGEEILCDTFAHMHAELGQFESFNQYVVELATGPGFTETTFSSLVANATNIRRLFDKEADNPYSEPLLWAQLASKQILDGFDDSKVASIALGRVMNTIDGIRKALQAASSGEDAWVGGITNHEACFVPIANALLGAWALHTRVVQHGDVGLSDRFFETVRAVINLTPPLQNMFTPTASSSENLFLLKHRITQ